MLAVPSRYLRLIPLYAFVLASACGDDSASPEQRDAASVPSIDADRIDGAAIDGAAIDGAAIDGGGGSRATGIAVINSDYSASSLSLLDLDGNVRHNACLSAASGPSGMTMTLSYDVVLPTEVPAGGPIALVDRANTAITWVDPATCGVRGQLGVGTGFASNPHDYVAVSATKAYVPRQDANKKPTAEPGDFDEGNDVLIVDPTAQKIVGRIDLLPFAPAGVLPRADRALLVRGMVFVSLNAISADYQTYATGRVVIIDPSTDRVTGTVDLPGLQNCGAMTFDPQHDWLLVACNGAYDSDPASQAATSGIATIAVTKTPPVAIEQVVATAVGTAPLSNLTLATVDGVVALTVAVGTLSGTPPDALWALPVLPASQLPQGPVATKLFASTEGYALSAVLYDRQHDRVVAADATSKAQATLRFFDHVGDGYVAGKTVITNPEPKKENLPPRALAFY